MTSAVYPVSKHKAISLIPAQMDGGFISENLNFYGYDCDEQYNIIKESEAKYILSRIKQDCSYLNHIYSKDGIFIYKVE